MAAVGVIAKGDKSGCTAVLIAPDLVASAAHCLAWTKDGTKVTFYPSTFTGKPGPAQQGSRVIVHPMYLPIQQRAPNSPLLLAVDIALLRLAKPVDPALAVPMPVAAEMPAGTEALFLVSFRGGKQGGQMRQRRCPLRSVEGGVLVVGCDVHGGESGSPLLLGGEGGPRLIGLVSARAQIGEERVALGPLAGPQLKELVPATTP